MVNMCLMHVLQMDPVCLKLPNGVNVPSTFQTKHVRLFMPRAHFNWCGSWNVSLEFLDCCFSFLLIAKLGHYHFHPLLGLLDHQ